MDYKFQRKSSLRTVWLRKLWPINHRLTIWIILDTVIDESGLCATIDWDSPRTLICTIRMVRFITFRRTYFEHAMCVIGNGFRVPVVIYDGQACALPYCCFNGLTNILSPQWVTCCSTVWNWCSGYLCSYSPDKYVPTDSTPVKLTRWDYCLFNFWCVPLVSFITSLIF